MCGIAGFIDFGKTVDRDTLINMTDILHHRGPDDSGYSFNTTENANIGLGHRRLSILDLTLHGHQPMGFEDVEIVYNGEVYNFKEIKKELETLGYSFDSNSDTEVILKAYHRWGLDAVNKFNGMFAFTIWDKKEQKVYILRDRSGIKPLYWYQKDQTILFASELKSFHQYKDFDKEINIDAVGLFLQYQYIPEPHSIFVYSKKLKAGHYLEIDLKKQKVTQTKYWDVIDSYNKPKLDISEDEAIKETEKLLLSAFEYRMVSDVPVGIFLSGGYDSSIVTALLQTNRTDKLKTFTIGFYEKGFDEAPYAKKVANYLGCEHTEYYCTQKDALEIIPNLPFIYDEPFADASSIPTTLVSKLARENVTVSLSADGGDEIFAGYDKYTQTLQYYNFFSKFPNFTHDPMAMVMNMINPEYIPILNKTYNFKTRYEKVKEILRSKDCVEAMDYTGMYFTKTETDEILKKKLSKIETNFDQSLELNAQNDDINKMLAIDYKTYMTDDILTKIDRAAMSVSLEGREPLLDYRIIEFAAQLPSHYKYKNGNKKHILKEITHKYLPKEMMDRPKMGFGVPIYEWFKDELKEYFLTYLDEKRLEQEGIFNPKEVIKLRDRYLSGEAQNVEKLWSILMFEMWYERWI
jgi:asparagine synthase (glutamine-hydrolysing)